MLKQLFTLVSVNSARIFTSTLRVSVNSLALFNSTSVNNCDLLVARSEKIMRATDKSRYSARTEFNNCFTILLQSFVFHLPKDNAHDQSIIFCS
jgi:hypothetical protein